LAGGTSIHACGKRPAMQTHPAEIHHQGYSAHLLLSKSEIELKEKELGKTNNEAKCSTIDKVQFAQAVKGGQMRMMATTEIMRIGEGQSIGNEHLKWKNR
jgi:hypothetical protein